MANINDSYARDLDLNLLRVFAVVAEVGSLTRAAQRLYVTQPAISAAMRRLASFVGADLLTRQGHGLVLTTRGAELLSAARAHLAPLVAAALSVPTFDPKASTATVRLGLADCLEAVLLPRLLERLEADAPGMQLVVFAVQFRNVEDMLLTRKIDLAVAVADELPRSICRRPIGPRSGFLCLYDPRFVQLPRPFTERDYYAQDHVVVSYAGDARGVVEDTLERARRVRVSVPAFGHVPDLVDGSKLVATVPRMFALHVVAKRPHLRAATVPLRLDSARLELLWSRVTDNDAASRYIRERVAQIVAAIDTGPDAGAPARVRARGRRRRQGRRGPS